MRLLCFHDLNHRLPEIDPDQSNISPYQYKKTVSYDMLPSQCFKRILSNIYQISIITYFILKIILTTTLYYYFHDLKKQLEHLRP